jgi:hypothetical protein
VVAFPVRRSHDGTGRSKNPSGSGLNSVSDICNVALSRIEPAHQQRSASAVSRAHTPSTGKRLAPRDPLTLRAGGASRNQLIPVAECRECRSFPEQCWNRGTNFGPRLATVTSQSLVNALSCLHVWLRTPDECVFNVGTDGSSNFEIQIETDINVASAARSIHRIAR